MEPGRKVPAQGEMDQRLWGIWNYWERIRECPEIWTGG